MSKIFCLLVLSLCLLFVSCNRKQSPANSGSRSGSLKVMSYNIHHANPPSKEGFIDIQAISRVIIEQKPDLVALQELDVHTNRSGKTLDEAKELAVLTGMNFYFAKAIDHDGGDYGVAILSRYPLENPRTHHLPGDLAVGGEPRVMATALIDLPGGEKIMFASTHLDAQRTDINRVSQMNAIINILKSEKQPVIIGGDLNAVDTSRVIKVLDESFVRTCIRSCPFTIPVDTPSKTIDFIAFRPADRFRVVDHKAVPEKYASDHLPVVSVIQLK